MTPRLTVIGLPSNRGKGVAIRAGVAQAKGEHILFCDADLSTPIEHYRDVRRCLEAGADLVIASRSVAGSRIEAQRPFHREWMSRVFNGLSRSLTGVEVTDVLCGFKGFRREAARALFAELRAERFAFDVELLALAQRSGMRLVEIPVTWRHVPDSSVRPLAHSLESLVELVAIARRLRRRP